MTVPTNVHAARSANSAVIGTIQPAAAVNATNCRKGWCAASGGYMRSRGASGLIETVPRSRLR
ncbi:MAG: hypothetical protein WD852_04360 [Methyloceanibacter sp.]